MSHECLATFYFIFIGASDMEKDAILRLIARLEEQLQEQQQQISDLKNQLQQDQLSTKKEPQKKEVGRDQKTFPEKELRPKQRGPAEQHARGQANQPHEKRQPQKSKAMSDLELWVGNYGLQILGVVIFLIGAGFGLKYSIERGWITPIMRFAAAITTGFGFIGLAEYIHQKKKKWADACLGGGVALLFGAIYYGYEYYHLFSINYAAVGTVLVAALGASLAIRYNSQVVATLSMLGSFVMPMFMSYQLFDPAFTAGYYLLLGACSVFLACRYDWLGLFVSSGLALVYVDMTTMHPFFVGINDYSLHFIIGMFATFTLIPFLFCLMRKCNWFAPLSILMVVLYCFPRFVINVQQMYADIYALDQVAVLVFVGLGLFYGILHFVLLAYGKNKKACKGVSDTLLMLSVSSFAGAIWTHFGGHARIVLMAIYSMLLYIVGACYAPSRTVRFMSIAMWAFPILHYIESLNSSAQVTYFMQNATFNFLFNSMSLSTFVLAGTFFVASYITHKCRQKLAQHEHIFEHIFEVFGLLTIMCLMLSTVWEFNYVSAGLSIFAALVFIIGRYCRRYVWQYVSAFAVFINIGFLAINHSHLVFRSDSWVTHFTFGAFALSVTLCELFRRFSDNRTGTNEHDVAETLHVLTVFAWFMWGYVAIVAYFGSPSRGAELYKMKNSILISYHIIWASIIYVLGIFKRNFAWVVAGIVMMLLSVGYIALSYQRLVYRNMLEMTHVIFGSLTMTSIICAYVTKKKEDMFDEETRLVVPYVNGFAALAAFVWGQVAIVSYFGKINVFDKFYIHKQTALTIYYTLASLVSITVGLFQQNKYIRYFGFALIASTLMKLMSIIISFDETFYRIIAFMVVGVLIILLSFVYQYLSKKITTEE